jgi:hypothetical protein
MFRFSQVPTDGMTVPPDPPVPGDPPLRPWSDPMQPPPPIDPPRPDPTRPPAPIDPQPPAAPPLPIVAKQRAVELAGYLM